MSISHSTCHLAPQGYFTAPSGRGVFGFPLYSPERQGRRDLFTSFPGAWRRVIGPSLGQSAALTKAPRNRCQTPPFPGPSRGGRLPLRPCHPPTTLPLQWLHRARWLFPGPRPGGWVRDLGGGWGVEAPPAAGRSSAGLPAARGAPRRAPPAVPGVAGSGRNAVSLGREAVARRCN